MPGGLQDGGRRKPWTVAIHKSCWFGLFPWLEDNDHRVRLPVNCGAVIEDSVAKRNMIFNRLILDGWSLNCTCCFVNSHEIHAIFITGIFQQRMDCCYAKTTSFFLIFFYIQHPIKISRAKLRKMIFLPFMFLLSYIVFLLNTIACFCVRSVVLFCRILNERRLH